MPLHGILKCFVHVISPNIKLSEYGYKEVVDVIPHQRIFTPVRLIATLIIDMANAYRSIELIDTWIQKNISNEQ